MVPAAPGWYQRKIWEDKHGQIKDEEYRIALWVLVEYEGYQLVHQISELDSIPIGSADDYIFDGNSDEQECWTLIYKGE